MIHLDIDSGRAIDQSLDEAVHQLMLAARQDTCGVRVTRWNSTSFTIALDPHSPYGLVTETDRWT